jgi:putative transposon-encoded protein
MTEEIVIEQVKVKKATKCGNAAHVALPKKLVGRKIYLLVEAKDYWKPYIHWDRQKTDGDHTYVRMEIAGPMGAYIRKEDAEKLVTRN